MTITDADNRTVSAWMEECWGGDYLVIQEERADKASGVMLTLGELGLIAKSHLCVESLREILRVKEEEGY